jgi:transposase
MAYKDIFYLKPLKEVLNNKQLIASYRILDNGSGLEIYVNPAETSDFKKTYQQVNHNIMNTMQKKPYQLIIVDNRDDVLRKVFYKSQFIIYQAISRGSFQDMAFEIDKLAKTAGVEAWLYIDQKNIYIHLKRGNRNLYEVIPRSPVA